MARYGNFYEPISGADPEARAETITRRQGPLDALREIFGDRMGPTSQAGERQPSGSLPWGLGNTDSQWRGEEQSPYARAWNPVPVTPTGSGPGGSSDADIGGWGADLVNDAIQKYIPLRRAEEEAETADTAFDEDYIKGAYERAKELWADPYDAEKDAISAEYGARIAQLQAELAGYQGALGGVNAAYASYATDANAILSEAAAVEAEALDPTAVVAEVDHTYAEFDGAMQETLAKIDGNGDVALAQAMTGEITRMQGIVTDGLRSDLGTQDNLHRLAGTQAQALANMAWKDDIYQAERQRFQIELEINQAINNQANSINNTRGQMDRAIAAVNAQVDDFSMTPDALWEAAMTDFAKFNDMTDIEIQDMNAIWANLMNNPDYPDVRANFGSFKGALMTEMHRKDLATFGMLGRMDALHQTMFDTEDVEGLALVEAMYATENYRDFEKAYDRVIMNRAPGMVLPVEVDRDAMAQSSKGYTAMLDLWGLHENFVTDYNAHVTTTAQREAIVSSKGSQAPDNYARRFQPPYEYRRNTLAPQAVQQFLATFYPGDQASRYVGGYGAGHGIVRKPGRGATNSDHQSGGALDLYGATTADLTRIAAWARQQPWASMVIYEGNSDHDTGIAGGAEMGDNGRGHVHVSLQLGYGFQSA